MDYRVVGATGIKVSCLTLGTMNFGGAGPFGKLGAVDVALAKRFLDNSLDVGVNSLDTSNIYSFGAGEQVLGEALAGRRDRFVLGTKSRFPMGTDPNKAGLSRRNLIEACEASLKRLRTDWIDIYWLHAWDGQTSVEETLRAVEDLIRAGKIRAFGVSNFSAWHIGKFLVAAEKLRAPQPAAQQIHYTLQARDAERELIPLAVDADIPLFVWSPLAGGLLSGKYRRDASDPAGTRRAAGWTEPPVHDFDALYDIVDALVEIASDRKASAAQVALAWLLGRHHVATLVLGARTEAQLADSLAAATLVLSDEETARLDRVSQTPLPYPYWHQLMAARDRLSAADLSLLGPYLNHTGPHG